MQIKKLIKQYLIFNAVILFLFFMIKEYSDNRPVKFESYSGSTEQFRKAMKIKFPIGSSVDRAIEILVKSGIQEIKIQDISYKANIKTGVKNAYYAIDCYYYASIFSLVPRAEYAVLFLVDKNRKILSTGAYRLGFLGEFWW